MILHRVLYFSILLTVIVTITTPNVRLPAGAIVLRVEVNSDVVSEIKEIAVQL